jgi:hypothetical protein
MEGLLIIGVAKALRLVLEIIKAFGLNHSGRSPDLLAPYLGSFDRSTVTGQLAPYFPQRLSAVVLQIEAPKGSLVSRNPQRLLFEFSGGGSAAPPTHRLKMANQLHAGSDHRRRQHLTPGHRELWNQRHLFADRNATAKVVVTRQTFAWVSYDIPTRWTHYVESFETERAGGERRKPAARDHRAPKKAGRSS